MSWKKNIFYCLLWSFYTVAVLYATADMSGAVCSSQNIPYYCGLLLAAVMAALLRGVASGLHRLAPGLTAFFSKRIGLRLTVQAALFVMFLTAGFVFRAENLESVTEAGLYYEIAEVAVDKSIPQIAHGAVYLYVWLLHLVFLFLGNNYIYGIILQMLLQGIAAVLLFFLVRKHIGALAAFVMLGFLTCAPSMIRGGLTLSPDMLYLCLWAVAAGCVAGCGKKQAPSPFLFAGMVSALLFYLDVAGALVFLLAFWTALRMRSWSRRRAAACLCCVVGFGVGFAGCVLADAYISQKDLAAVLYAWGRLYQPGSFRLPVTVDHWDTLGEGLVLLELLVLGIYSFWFAVKRERLAACMLAVCAVTLALCFGVFTPEMPGTSVLYLLLILMAGIALEQCFSRREWKPKRVRKRAVVSEEPARKEEEIALQQEEEENETAEFHFMPVDSAEAPGGQEGTAEDGAPKAAEGRQAEAPDGGTEISGGGEAQTPKQEIKYIENPLPLPKKHVKKTLDYDFPVAEDDDFDF